MTRVAIILIVSLLLSFSAPAIADEDTCEYSLKGSQHDDVQFSQAAMAHFQSTLAEMLKKNFYLNETFRYLTAQNWKIPTQVMESKPDHAYHQSFFPIPISTLVTPEQILESIYFVEAITNIGIINESQAGDRIPWLQNHNLTVNFAQMLALRKTLDYIVATQSGFEDSLPMAYLPYLRSSIFDVVIDYTAIFRNFKNLINRTEIPKEVLLVPLEYHMRSLGLVPVSDRIRSSQPSVWGPPKHDLLSRLEKAFKNVFARVKEPQRELVFLETIAGQIEAIGQSASDFELRNPEAMIETLARRLFDQKEEEILPSITEVFPELHLDGANKLDWDHISKIGEYIKNPENNISPAEMAAALMILYDHKDQPQKKLLQKFLIDLHGKSEVLLSSRLQLSGYFAAKSVRTVNETMWITFDLEQEENSKLNPSEFDITPFRFLEMLRKSPQTLSLTGGISLLEILSDIWKNFSRIDKSDLRHALIPDVLTFFNFAASTTTGLAGKYPNSTLVENHFPGILDAAYRLDSEFDD